MEKTLKQLISQGFTIRRIRVEMARLGYDLTSKSDEELICQILNG